ncbi:dipeptidase [Nibrella viscosa]|uniref:Dipeptidase n=2 Tax=Nibrella viscosa TaxID=1084524 RepID=A0ABP8K7U0_9BACT
MAQPLTMSQLDTLTEKYVRASYNDLYTFLSLPNNSRIDGHIQPNIDWLQKAFTQRGFSVEVLPTKGKNPLVFAEHKADKTPAGKLKTLLFYMHFDGQPVQPADWQQASPFTPVLKAKGENGTWQPIPWEKLQTTYNRTDGSREWRIFGRSSSDDKGPIVMLLTALTALQQEHIPIPYNIKVILDSEEEVGSPHLADAVGQYKNKLQADFMMIMDGGRHLSNQPTLIYGARGIASVTLTTYGPRGAQHSGHYGNYAPNPALRLTQLLGSMKDEDGRVTIPGYYDGITIDASVARILAAVPDDPALIQQTIGVTVPDKVGRTYQEALQYPTLNIRGLSSAHVGVQAGTIIPDKAIAELDLRLVPESDPQRLIRLIRQHIEQKGYHIIDHEPTDADRLQYPKLIQMRAAVGSLPFRTEFGGLEDQWLTQAMKRAFGREPIKIRTMGGTVPIAPFIRTLNIPAIHVPMVNLDNNQHAANENLRLGNYLEGIKTWLAIFTE